MREEKDKTTEKNLGQFKGKVLFFNSQLTSLGSSYEMRTWTCMIV